MSQRLNREGFHCETAATANEAIQRLQEGGYESLISDIHMEGNVQLEFVARVAATAAGLPVIVLTGYPTVETAARAVGLRVTAYLTKPPDLGTLCSTLREAVHDYRATRRLRDGWQRLQDWSAELERLRSVFEQSATNDRADALRGYVQLSLRNLAIWLVELDQLMTAEDAKSTVSREQFGHRREQLLDLEGFGQRPRRARGPANLQIFFGRIVPAARQRDDRQVGVAASQREDQFNALHLGHHDVRDAQVRGGFLAPFQRDSSIACISIS